MIVHRSWPNELSQKRFRALEAIARKIAKMNPESTEDTKEMEEMYAQDAIGSTMFSKSWLLSALENLDDNDKLESVSDMSCSDDVAKFLVLHSAHFKLLSLILPQNGKSSRVQELSLVILSNMLRVDFAALQSEAACLQIPVNVLLSHDHLQQVQVLSSLAQYLTIYADAVSKSLASEDLEDISQDDFACLFDTIAPVTILMASTLNGDLLSKLSRLLFSIVDLASDQIEAEAKLEFLASAPALGALHESLKQALANQVMIQH